MTWKVALLAALKSRRRRDLFRAVFVAVPATVLGSFDKGIGTGLLLGLWVGAGVFVTEVVVAARQLRKSGRPAATP